MTETTIILVLAAVAVCTIGLACVVFLDRDTRVRRARINRAARLQGGFAKGTEGRASLSPSPDVGASSSTIKALHVFETHIQQAGLRITPVELVVQVGLGVLALYATGVLVFSAPPVPTAVMSIVLPIGAAGLVLRTCKSRRMASFCDDLPEALDVFSRGLKAGRPVAESIAVVVENSRDPIRSEFGRCQDELRLGASLTQSLDRLCRRMPTPEVSFFSVAVSLQGQTGGNLVETMENLAAQLRDRRKLKKKAKALTAEARASAVILAGLPFTVAAAIAFLNPSYLETLYADPRGQIMSVIALMSIGLGVFMMMRMGKLHV